MLLEPTSLSKSFYAQGVPLRSGAYSKKLSYDSHQSQQGWSTESRSTMVLVDDSKDQDAVGDAANAE
jgi:hypothetical protein